MSEDNRSFEAGGKKFKLNKINAFDQFHIAKKLSPVLGELFPVLGKMSGMTKEKLEDPKFLEEKLGDFSPVLAAFSKLPDEDADRILIGLCSAVEMHQPEFNSWARVAKSGQMMIQDLELPTLLNIAGRAFAYNVSSFFALGIQSSRGVGQAPNVK
jgi:hypothetical protein